VKTRKRKRRRTEAERLLKLGRHIRFPRDKLIVAEVVIDMEAGLARVKLALRFLDARPALQLRAIAERWPLAQIVRELY